MQIRPEEPADASAISALITDAFRVAQYASGNEAAIVAALRDAGALVLSLVAEENGQIVGHAAFSPVSLVDSGSPGWFGLGPVATLPDHQRRGIAGDLIHRGLDSLRHQGAAGCVVLGDPDYYGRFGFQTDPALTLPGIDAKFFQCIAFAGPVPSSTVRYHPAFNADPAPQP